MKGKQPVWVQWIVLFGLLSAFAFATGRLTVKSVPDSASYQEYPFDSLEEALRSTRTFGYPALLRVVEATVGLGLLPLVQILIHTAACAWFHRELGHWRVHETARWAATLAIAFGCTVLDNVATISTDCVAASLGVMTATSLLAWVRAWREVETTRAAMVIRSGLVALLATLAIAVRPAYLSLIIWLPIAGTLLLTMRRQDQNSERWGKAILASSCVTSMVVLPIIAWVTFRGVTVGDYAVLPFGHQNLAGITIQLVSDEELSAIKGDSVKLADAIIQAKRDYWETVRKMSPSDDRSTMAMEARWDDYVWLVVVPAASGLYGDDTIANHNAIAQLNRNIIARYPMRYTRWLILAMRRAIWGTMANIWMHPVFLPIFMVVIAWEAIRMHLGLPSFVAAECEGTRALFLIAFTYFFIQTSFVILTSPPLGRFADANAIFIPASIASLYIQRVQRG